MFTAEELIRVRSEWASENFSVMNKYTDEQGMAIINCPAFIKLVAAFTHLIVRDLEIGAISAALAYIEVGIAIGRAQATRELVKIDGEK